MKKELSAKEKVIIGIIALVISGILTSYLLVEHQKDWIMLIAIIIFTILFLKCFSCEEIERTIYNKLSNNINVVSIVLVFIAVVLLPESAGGMIPKSFQGVIYFVSFIFWFAGLYFQEIKAKNKR
ncbi:MAG: hypothetical protein SOW32_03960 [Agathobacter sp.]|nr:hypothetical protein [Lachnospiraceae bacterium]MDY2589324.1 hypothetical protein [Agathobacter sp.]